MAGPIYLILLDGGRYGHLYGPLSAIEPVNVLSGKDDSWANGELALGEPVFGEPYRDMVMASDPLGYWRLGEQSGTTAADTAGGIGNGTYTNGPVLGEPGVLSDNSAAWFDGVDDIVTLPVAPIFALGSGPITFEAWNNPVSWVGGTGVLTQLYTTSSLHFEIGYDVDTTGVSTARPTVGFFENNNWSVARGPDNVGLNQWHHLVGTWDGVNTLRVYHDGVLVGSSNTGAHVPVPHPTNAYVIGRRHDSGNHFFPGKIDEVAIYDRALTPLEVATHYAAAHAVYGPMIEDESGAPVYTSSGVVI